MNESAQATQLKAIVVAYRSGARITQCIEGLVAAGADDILVIDNSNDPVTRLRVTEFAQSQSHPRVCYVRTQRNLGFGAAANAAERLLEPSKWLAVVSADVTLDCRFRDLIAEAEKVGANAVAGLLRTIHGLDGINARPKTGPFKEILRAVVGTVHSMTTSQTADGRTLQVGQLDGCFLVMPRTVFTSFGGFDERFELYFEDVDLCLSMPPGTVWLYRKVCGTHIGGASAKAAPHETFIAFRISRVRFLRKRWGRRGTAAAAASAVLEYLSRSLFRCPEGDRTRARAIQLQLKELCKPGSVWVLPNGRRKLLGTSNSG